MLPPDHRLRPSSSIAHAVRRGNRAGTPLLVVHVLRRPDAPEPARAALVVGRTVGSSVVRHRVQRRLRHLLTPRLALLEPGTDVVVRARPEARTATSAELGGALDNAMSRLGRSAAPALEVSPR